MDDLKEIAKTLRSLPVADLASPTGPLVGAPNVGKSSMVRLLSSGKPEVQNYPFTTRGIQMGHIISESRRRGPYLPNLPNLPTRSVHCIFSLSLTRPPTLMRSLSHELILLARALTNVCAPARAGTC